MKNKFYKILSIQKSSAGFTLIELLVAMAITTIVISITGFGLVTMMNANKKVAAETERQANLNRALDFMTDEVRMAIKVDFDEDTNGNSSLDTGEDINGNGVLDTKPGWAWTNLGGGSPAAKLYLQIPLKSVQSMTDSGDLITIPNHGLSSGNAIMFTGPGTIAGGLSKDTVYYVTTNSTNTFQLSTTVGGSAINLTSNSSGSLTANQLLIYFIRENTPTWLGPQTINRSAGPCETSYAETNCPALVDSINTNGFTASVASSREVTLQLSEKLYQDSTATYDVSNKAFPRSVPLSSKCLVPAINGSTNTAANTAVTNAGLIARQNTVTTGTVGEASNQFPPASSSVTCNTTVTYNYRP